MEKYNLGEAIGSTASGVVYKGIDLETLENVTVRKLHMNYENGIPNATLREISLLKVIEHDNIVKLLDVISNIDNECCIIFEHLDTDLKEFMEDYPKYSKHPGRIKNLLRQILSGVTYFHERRIVHRNLKPYNLLLDLNGSVVKIADFGLAQVASPWYTAPEILLGSSEYFTPVDVWSVGCIFAEMILHQPLFAGDSNSSQLNKIFSIMGTPNERTWPRLSSLPNYRTNFRKWNPKNLADFFPTLEPAGVDLLSGMLCMNPAGRISACDALKHAYFNKNDNYDNEEEEEKEN